MPCFLKARADRHRADYNSGLLSYNRLDAEGKVTLASIKTRSILGQGGSYLAEFLLSKGYRVIGMARRTNTIPYERIEHIQNLITLIPRIHASMLEESRRQSLDP